MSVPGRVDAAALLLSLEPPPWFMRHSRAVAEIAAWLGRRWVLRGVAVDRALVDAAALLHDVDKLSAVRASSPAIGRSSHGEGSALWLRDRGHPELAAAVAAHPVVRLADDEWWRRWLASASPEERILAYADKRAGQRLEPMAGRFASWRRRYPPDERPDAWSDATLGAIRRRAETLEAEVCGLAGVEPAHVARLPWTIAALRAARAAMADAGRDAPMRRGQRAEPSEERLPR